MVEETRGGTAMSGGMKTPAAGLVSLIAVGAAALVGASQGPQLPRRAVWYARLDKPRATPSGPAIAVTWSVLEVLLCVSGARLMHDAPGPARNRALVGWWGIVVGLAAFPASFFGRRRLGESTVVSVGMLASASAGLAYAARVDRPAAASLVPVAAWLCVATALSAELWRRNPQ